MKTRGQKAWETRRHAALAKRASEIRANLNQAGIPNKADREPIRSPYENLCQKIWDRIHALEKYRDDLDNRCKELAKQSEVADLRITELRTLMGVKESEDGE